MTTHDAIVVGLGAMGAATAWQLAKRGARVLGLERFDIPHAMGSSHGTNRIIRLAYFEHPSYVPLLRRAYELWRDLETEAGEQLLFVTGGVDAGAPDSRLVRGSMEACKVHGLPHEVVSASELARRYPGYRVPEGHVAVLQPDAGFVMSERAIVAFAGRALEAGADLRARERMIRWEPTPDGGVRVITTKATYEAGRLVLATGAWIGEHVPELADEAIPERQVLAWFQPKEPSHFRLGAFPVGIVEHASTHYYQFPVHGVPGFKIGVYHHRHERGPADTLSREPNDADEALLREAVRAVFPAADGSVLAMKVCLFTNTTDEHFVVDTLPDAPQVIVASPCSGHGFKFASVMGEVLADLATKGRTRHDLGLFGLARLGARVGASA